ncbi:MAG: YncE family protein, partial [Spirochaetales bacterium]|nr:YncE family protein [Spirochaetales bacterium]
MALMPASSDPIVTIRHPIRALRILALSLLCLRPPAADAAPGATGKPAALYSVVFRTAPQNAVIVDATTTGAPAVSLTLLPADNGGRKVELAAGVHELVFSARGYEDARLMLTVDRAGIVVEKKLERSVSALRLVATVPVGDRPKSVAFTPDGRFIVVAPLSGTALSVLDASTGALVASPSPPAPWAARQGFVEMAFPPGRGELWVSQMYTDRIHVFSLEGFAYLRTLPCGGSFPKVLAVHPDGRVFVSNWLSKTVSVLSADGSDVLGVMQTGDTPRGLAFSVDGGIVYVADFGSGAVLMYDAYSFDRVGELDDGVSAQGGRSAKRHLVVDPVRGRLYASDMARASVFAWDLASGRLIAEVWLGARANTNTIQVSADG